MLRASRHVLIGLMIGFAGLDPLMGQTVVGTVFSYQGRLLDGGAPVDESYDLEFQLFDAEAGGAPVSEPLSLLGVQVNDGLFTVDLDFGPVFADEALWLEVRVRPSDGPLAYTTLSPRQRLTGAPFSHATRGVVVDADGNVGLGTSDPQYRLDVVGDLRCSNRVAAGNAAIIDDFNGIVFDISQTITDFSSSDLWTPFATYITLDPSEDLTGANIYSHDHFVIVPSENDQDFWNVDGPYLYNAFDGSGSVEYTVGGVFVGSAAQGQVGNMTGAAAVAATNDNALVENSFGFAVYTGNEGPGGLVTNNYGLYVATPDTVGPVQNHFGLYFESQTGALSANYAIYVAGGNSYLNGDLEVTGNLSKGGGSFKIDHPLDPENKYLYHSFVESPDMMNIYNGNALTDDEGLAVVELPEWFEALNRDFRYQLTVIGQFALAIVADEIEGNQFSIRTDMPHVKVSWQVTGIRHDRYADANRIPVEEDKPEAKRGRYLHAEAFDMPDMAEESNPRSENGRRIVESARSRLEKRSQP